MEVGIAQCVNKGMQRDYSMDKASQEFAYENKNIRITTNGENSFLSVTNERSTELMEVQFQDGGNLTGELLGHAVINNYLILFIYDTEDYVTKIIRLEFKNNLIEGVLLYKGNLNSAKLDNLKIVDTYPIECVVSYEGDDVQKVYWVDGVNQPRMINVCKTYPSNYDFNFVPSIPKDINVTIEKQHLGIGNFPSGVIQYYITYYNKYGPETNSAYQSPLYYISPSDRGGEVDVTQTCNFIIKIKPNEDFNFEYIRVYSVIRTSLNSEPIVQIVGDLKLNDTNLIQVVDSNNHNTPVASTDVMFLGGNTISASTIEYKDNTVFLGDITSIKEAVVKDLKDVTNLGDIGFYPKKVDRIYDITDYGYTPNLDGSSITSTTFKYLEYYRFGLQVQLPTGEWTSTIYIGDLQNTIAPNSRDIDITDDSYYIDLSTKEQYDVLTCVRFEASEELLEVLKKHNIINWRLMVAQHNSSTRTIKAQGLVLPTIFNLKERNERICHATPLWTLNTCVNGYHYCNIDGGIEKPNYSASQELEIKNSPHNLFNLSYTSTSGDDIKSILHNIYATSSEISEVDGYYITGIRPIIQTLRSGKIVIGLLFCFEILIKKLNVTGSNEPTVCRITNINFKPILGTKREKTIQETINYAYTLTWSHFKDGILKDIEGSEREVPVTELLNYRASAPILNPGELPSADAILKDIKANDWWYTTLARDINYDAFTYLLTSYKNNYFLDANICNFISPDLDNVQGDLKFRIVGYTNIDNSIADYNINVDSNVIGASTYDYTNHNLNYYNFYYYNNSNSNYDLTGIKSFPLWPYANKLYQISYWHPGGGLVTDTTEDGTVTYFKLKSKKFANMWICSQTSYFYDTEINNLEYDNVEDFNIIDNDNTIINNNIYKGKYENLIIPDDSKDYRIVNSTEIAVNQSTSLNEITTYLNNNNFEEADRQGGAILIKDSASKHGVFKFKNKNGSIQLLPNYNPLDIEDNNLNDTSYTILGENLSNDKMVNVDLVAVLNARDINIGNETTQEFLELLDKNSNNIEITSIEYINIGSINQIEIKGKIPSSDGEIIKLLVIPKSQYVDKTKTIKVIKNGNENEILGEYENLDFIKYLFDSGSFSGTVNIIIYINTEDATDEILDDYKISKLLFLEMKNKNVNSNKVLNITDSFIMKDSEDIYTVSYYKNHIFNGVPFKTFRSPSILNGDIQTNSKLFVGEFYLDYSSDTFMGGSNENALELNTFIPISGKYYLDKAEYKFASGYGLEGDTYYQRWDNLRIYPTTDEDENQPIDAVSLMLESYTNLDGDIKKIRGRSDSTTLTVENTNETLNTVYSQSNNYITSFILDEKFEDGTHPTMYIWSLSKTYLSDIDNWTKINLSSAKRLDGDKGKLTKIKKWNNQLLAFQEKGIALINFNQQTTLSTQEGVPVEIGNSGKVTGHYYITTTQGCKNKWSIIESPYGVYFIDSYNKSINVLNDGIKSLTTINLFEDWIRENENGVIWKPNKSLNNGFKSFYDPIHKDVYFINSNYALCYNELLEQFVSFYDYQNMSILENINNHIYASIISPEDTPIIKLHKMFEGKDYCNLFNKQCPFYMIYKINKDPFIDKTWTGIEYRADVFDIENYRVNIPETDYKEKTKIINETFDILEVWNEYQRGTTRLKNNRYPNSKNKFRIWRVDIPRDNEEGNRLNRIRNPWIMLKLIKTENTQNCMEFHDLVIKYLQ